MALMSKRNSFFSFEESDIEGVAAPVSEEEIREQAQVENEIETEVATIEEEAEVVESLAEQHTENEVLIENAPEQVTEEIVTESNKQYLLALGRLGMGADQLRYIKIGTESSMTPLQRLKVNQEGIIDTIKAFFARIWEWIKKMAGKIKDFFVGIGRRIASLARRAKGLFKKKVGNVDKSELDPKGGEALASLCKYIGVSSSALNYTNIVTLCTPTYSVKFNHKDLDNSEMKVSNPGPLSSAIENKVNSDSTFSGLRNLQPYAIGSSQGVANIYLSAGDTTDPKEAMKKCDAGTEDEAREYIKGIVATQSKFDSLVDFVANKLEGLQKKSADSIQKYREEVEKYTKYCNDQIKKADQEEEKDPEAVKILKKQQEIMSVAIKMIGNLNKSHVFLASVTDALIKNAEKVVNKGSKLPKDPETK